jgi:hypothetical protein
MAIPKLFALLTIFTFSQLSLFSQDSTPSVFILGENESEYLELNTAYSQSLLEACNNDIQKAFDLWLGMMSEMDAYAEKIDYDIRGVKVMFHVFWNPDGSVAKLGYLLRPDSKLLPKEELNAFFSSFIKRYKLPLTSSKKFMHYTGATFPTYSEAYDKK